MNNTHGQIVFDCKDGVYDCWIVVMGRTGHGQGHTQVEALSAATNELAVCARIDSACSIVSLCREYPDQADLQNRADIVAESLITRPEGDPGRYD